MKSRVEANNQDVRMILKWEDVAPPMVLVFPHRSADAIGLGIEDHAEITGDLPGLKARANEAVFKHLDATPDLTGDKLMAAFDPARAAIRMLVDTLYAAAPAPEDAVHAPQARRL